MSAHFEGRLERKGPDGQWEEITTDEDWFNFQSYFIYGWFADVRNYAKVPPLPHNFEKAGEPICCESDFNYTLLTKYLFDFDYDQVVEDRRHGRHTLPIGEGYSATWREHLGEGWFERLATLKKLGVERLVFNFF
ncbi:hypothetical protein TOTORO_01680 [Serratia phage vB_SmaS-Totoro]|nr:hypothetical protein TOTORO_01680 [Serratia phage vB_SmaS-Totoro]